MEQYKLHCFLCFSEENLLRICCENSILCEKCCNSFNEKKNNGICDDYLQKCAICRKKLNYNYSQNKLDLEKIIIRLSIIYYFYFYFQLFFNDFKEKDFSFEKFWSSISMLLPFNLI